MATVYAVLSGTRYVATERISAHLTLEGARAAAEAVATGAEQDPPADGFVASWLADDMQFVGIVAEEAT